MIGPRPAALLFDWDNTLVDAWDGIAAALNAVFRRRAMPLWSAARTRAEVRGSARDSFPALFGAGWEQDLACFYATLRQHHTRHLRPMPGAAALLAASAAYPCALVSNKQGALLRAEVAHLGWADRFATVIGAGDAAADKPDPAPLRLALARLGQRPGPSTWFIGDTALDMRAARAGFCRAVLVGDAATDGGVAACGADAHFRDAFHLASEIAALA